MESFGQSYAGKRSLVCMKHVGLNVAADAFVNSAITAARGLLVAWPTILIHSCKMSRIRVFTPFAMLSA